MKITVNRAGLHQLEHNIMPPMRQAITMPLNVDGHAIDIYVCTSQWSDPGAVSDEDMTGIAFGIADALERT